MIQEFCDWLAGTSISQLFGSLDWFVPAVQTVHILAIGSIVTMLMMVNFRLLGITRAGPNSSTLGYTFFPWVWWTLLILLVTGILLTVTEPARELMNYAFRIKMLLVVILMGVTFALQSILVVKGRASSAAASRFSMDKALAAASLLLCISIVLAGRFIAYI